MNDLDKILDKLCEDPAFVRAYREERITWELQARAVCRYLRGEVERLAEERHPLTTPIYIAKCYACGNEVRFQILEDSQGPNNE